jgi:hypothetical protein
MSEPSLSVLVGQTLSRVIVDPDKDRMTFVTNEGEAYSLLHEQDCCEYVRIEEVIGNLDDLVGSPVIEAEEVSSEDYPAPVDADESYTWTFYKFGTAKGFVTIRWLGESNGYYSESVSFVQDIKPAEH